MINRATEVFGIPELAEQILLALPVRDLLLAQRINRSIHATIAGSPQIQEALFFRHPHSSAKQTPATVNPLICRIFNVPEGQVRLHNAHIVDRTPPSLGNPSWYSEDKDLLGIALF